MSIAFILITSTKVNTVQIPNVLKDDLLLVNISEKHLTLINNSNPSTTRDTTASIIILKEILSLKRVISSKTGIWIIKFKPLQKSRRIVLVTSPLLPDPFFSCNYCSSNSLYVFCSSSHRPSRKYWMINRDKMIVTGPAIHRPPVTVARGRR